MNGIDIAILVILCGFLLKGLLRGLLKEVCSLAGFFIGAFLAFRYHGPLAESLLKQVDLPAQIAVAITFTVLFLATMVFFLALGFLLSRFVKLLFLGGFNRLIGGVVRFVPGHLAAGSRRLCAVFATPALGNGHGHEGSPTWRRRLLTWGPQCSDGSQRVSEMRQENQELSYQTTGDSLVQLEFAKVVDLVVGKTQTPYGRSLAAALDATL